MLYPPLGLSCGSLTVIACILSLFSPICFVAYTLVNLHYYSFYYSKLVLFLVTFRDHFILYFVCSFILFSVPTFTSSVSFDRGRCPNKTRKLSHQHRVRIFKHFQPFCLEKTFRDMIPHQFLTGYLLTFLSKLVHNFFSPTHYRSIFGFLVLDDEQISCFTIFSQIPFRISCSDWRANFLSTLVF